MYTAAWQDFNPQSARSIAEVGIQVANPDASGPKVGDVRLHSLGADEIIDYSHVRFEDKLRNLDVVLNTVDADTGCARSPS